MGLLYNVIVALGLFFGTESEFNSLSQDDFARIEYTYEGMSGLSHDDDGN